MSVQVRPLPHTHGTYDMPPPGPTRTGRDCFEYFYSELTALHEHIFGAVAIPFVNGHAGYNPYPSHRDDAHLRAYEIMFERHKSQLGHYFTTLYRIVRFVEQKAPSNAKEYTGLLRAQLSTYEHVLLFYNGLSKYACDDHGVETFRPLIIKYSLLDNMDTSSLLLPENHRPLYPESAYK